MAASKLPRDPLQPPPARPQPQHLRHVVRRLHHLPPWIFPRRGFRDSLLVHSLSPQLAKEGAIPRGAEGAVFHGARQRGHSVGSSYCRSHGSGVTDTRNRRLAGKFRHNPRSIRKIIEKSERPLVDCIAIHGTALPYLGTLSPSASIPLVGRRLLACS